MQILSWLMKHPILTAWVLTALAIVLNLERSGPDNSAKQEDNAKVAVVAHQDKDGEKAESGEHQDKAEASANGDAKQVVAKNAASGNTTTAVTAVAAVGAVTAAGSAVAANAGTETNQLVMAKAGVNAAQTEEQAKPAETSVGGTTAEVAVTAAAEPVKVEAGTSAGGTGAATATQQPASATQDQSGAAQDVQKMSDKDLLALARNAFWQRKFDHSAELYQELVNKDPESIAYRGELGNVFWHSGKEREAAAIYAQIAVPMVNQGRSQEVMNILGFIGAYFPEKAKELQGMLEK